MSKTFCNDADLNNAIGFSPCIGVNTSELIDQTVNIDYHICNKMGSSIPTIFSRMFLFSSAYKDINLLEQVNPGVAHNNVVDSISDNSSLKFEYMAMRP